MSSQTQTKKEQMTTELALTWSEKDADYIRQFDSVIRVKPYKLTRQTRAEIDAKLADLAQYENAHTDFDIHDLNGEVASVYLFQKGGKLYARGANHTQVFRNPLDLYKFLPRSKRIHNITLITKHEAP